MSSCLPKQFTQIHTYTWRHLVSVPFCSTAPNFHSYNVTFLPERKIFENSQFLIKIFTLLWKLELWNPSLIDCICNGTMELAACFWLVPWWGNYGLTCNTLTFTNVCSSIFETSMVLVNSYGSFKLHMKQNTPEYLD